MDTDSFTVYMKTEDIYLYTWKDVERRFDTSNYELEREKTKKVKIDKRWIRWENKDRVCHIDTKTYRYLTW